VISAYCRVTGNLHIIELELFNHSTDREDGLINGHKAFIVVHQFCKLSSSILCVVLYTGQFDMTIADSDSGGRVYADRCHLFPETPIGLIASTTSSSCDSHRIECSCPDEKQYREREVCSREMGKEVYNWEREKLH